MQPDSTNTQSHNVDRTSRTTPPTSPCIAHERNSTHMSRVRSVSGSIFGRQRPGHESFNRGRQYRVLSLNKPLRYLTFLIFALITSTSSQLIACVASLENRGPNALASHRQVAGKCQPRASRCRAATGVSARVGVQADDNRRHPHGSRRSPDSQG